MTRCKLLEMAALTELSAAEAYVTKVKVAAEALVADRLLLPSDADADVRAAEESVRF